MTAQDQFEPTGAGRVQGDAPSDSIDGRWPIQSPRLRLARRRIARNHEPTAAHHD